MQLSYGSKLQLPIIMYQLSIRQPIKPVLPASDLVPRRSACHAPFQKDFNAKYPQFMSDFAFKEEWGKIAPYWITEMRETPNATREVQLDPPMLAQCGDVTGMRIIDLGCGEGRFSRKLSRRNAQFVLGLDSS